MHQAPWNGILALLQLRVLATIAVSHSSALSLFSRHTRKTYVHHFSTILLYFKVCELFLVAQVKVLRDFIFHATVYVITTECNCLE